MGSQCGLLVVGLAIGAAPNYPMLAVLKFLVGGFQQVRLMKQTPEEAPIFFSV